MKFWKKQDGFGGADEGLFNANVEGSIAALWEDDPFGDKPIPKGISANARVPLT